MVFEENKSSYLSTLLLKVSKYRNFFGNKIGAIFLHRHLSAFFITRCFERTNILKLGGSLLLAKRGLTVLRPCQITKKTLKE